MTAITLGDANLFLKGLAELIFTDPQTGNIVGFDSVGSDAAITSSVNLPEVAGGIGNPVVGVFPDTVRLTGTYTSQAFSLETRKLITGGTLAYNATAPVCETIKASGTSLTVSRTPVKHYAQPESDTYAWCYVQPVGAENYPGTNYGVDPETGIVQDFIATADASYNVFYFAKNASAQSLTIYDVYNPANVAVSIKFGVYAKQNNSVTGGTLQGWFYVFVPLAIPNGDAGVTANQTTNATTDYAWMAISKDNNGLSCADCVGVGNPLAYYVYVPCGDANEGVKALVVPGGGVTVAVGADVQLPVKYVMPNDTLVQPTYTDLTYQSSATGKATVSSAGVVHGVASGDAVVTATLTKADGTTVSTTAAVTVTA